MREAGQFGFFSLHWLATVVSFYIKWFQSVTVLDTKKLRFPVLFYLNPSFESVHLLIIQVNTVLIPSSPFLSPAYCKGDWFVIILTINHFNFSVSWSPTLSGTVGGEFGTVFMWFLPSQMCVFSQVPVCVYLCPCVCVCMYFCARY